MVQDVCDQPFLKTFPTLVLSLILQDATVSFITMKPAPLPGFSRGLACDFEIVFGYFCAC